MHSLITEEGNTKKGTYSGNLQITQGSQPIFVSALDVPSLKDNLISVGKMNKEHNIVFTKDGVYLQNKVYLKKVPIFWRPRLR